MDINVIKISIITPLYNTPEKYLMEMIESVKHQTYSNWELCLADASDENHSYVGEICAKEVASDPRIKYTCLEKNGGISINSNACMSMVTGNYIGILDHDDILHVNAMEKVAEVIAECDSEFVYTDEAKFIDSIDSSFGENYKPDFGMDELRAHNYICHFNVFSKKLFDEIGGYRKKFDGSQDHDLVLRLCEKAQNIRHISEVLYYWRVHENSVAMNINAKRYAIDAAVSAVQESIGRNGEYGKARNIIEGSRYKIDYSDQFAPKVSVLIISGNESYVEYVISEIEHSTIYSNLEFIINEKVNSDNFRSEHEVKNINFAKIKESINDLDSEYIILINNHILNFSKNWMQELLILCQGSWVGCVGMKAVQTGGLLLHTRVVYDGDKIRIPYYGHVDGIEGYEAELTITRNTSMLDGGVLLLSRDRYLDIVEECDNVFNFCELSLRLFLMGYKNVYTPFGCVTLDSGLILCNLELLTKLWKDSGHKIDPYYNYHLNDLKIDKEKKLPHNSSAINRMNVWKMRCKVLKELGMQSVNTLRNEGIHSFAEKTRIYLQNRKNTQQVTNLFVGGAPAYKDVLFISGCGSEVPHPHRYRVTHQKEQLESRGIHCEDVFYINLSLEMVRYYTTFIFYRCPYTDVIGEFIRLAREQRKAVIYDIDDLVIDSKYTNKIPYVQSLDVDSKKLYDDGIERMGRTLSLCDSVITTTERLATELRNYVPEAFINRNTASEEMLHFSEIANKQYKEGTLTVVVDSKKSIKIIPKDSDILIGYFSGSITHNVDFGLVMPALVRIMEEYNNVKLCVVGELNIPEELSGYCDRIVSYPFVDYKELPKLIRSVDINIAPIENTIFNEAKSENKWMEASLVRVPTIASDVGAFHVAMEDGITGLLCDNTEQDWYRKLKLLIDDKELRQRLALNAYKYVLKHYITTRTANNLAEYIKTKRAKTFAMVLPSTQVSGGIIVALKHCEIMRKQGYNILIIASNPTLNYMVSGEEKFPVVYMEKEPVEAHIDKMVATMWVTVDYVLSHPTTVNRYYLVQGYEPDFYNLGKIERQMAYDTYNKNGFIKYITISKWCQCWLKEEFNIDARYAENGLDVATFYPLKRNMKGKIRVLVEGDSAVDYKNVDESFQIVNQLNREQFEVWYISYNGMPKDWYHFDEFIQKVPYSEMPFIYRKCDILIKSSVLESFSYPPLEMMSTGGYVIVTLNDGNREYLVNNENCMLYNSGDINDALEKIYQLITDKELQYKLYENGLATSRGRDWSNIEEHILHLYDL